MKAAWAMLVCLFLIGMGMAGNFTRPTSTVTITPLPTDAYYEFWQSMGGNTIPQNATAARFNFTQFIRADLRVYTDVMGFVALAIIVAMPFLLMWLMQSDIVPVAIAGILVSGFLLLFVPAQFTILAGVFIALAVLVVIYTLYTKRT